MAQSLQIPVEINLKTKKEDFDKLTSKLKNKGVAVSLKVTNEELKNFRETIQKKFTKPINVPLSVTQGQVNKLRNQIHKASKKPIEVSVKAFKVFIESTALMKVPNGDTVTQFDLHDCEAASLIKIDLLSVESLDKIHNCLDLLCDYGYIERQPTLKETYEKYIGIYNLERESKDMWSMVHKHQIQSLFQMEQQSGIQGIALTKPENVEDLAHLNSVIRLMAQEKGAEQPLEKYARFKKNINLWYDEMNRYGLTKDEQEILRPYLGFRFPLQ